MDWKFGSTATDWIFSSTSYEPAAGEFTIVSAPAEVQRGGSYTLPCTNVSEAPSAATLDGQPITVDAFDSDSIDFTIPINTLAGHGAGKVLSFTVAGVTRTVTVPHNPDTGRLYTTLTSFDPGPGNVFAGMTDLDTGLPMTPAAGGQVVHTSPTTPNSTAQTYPVSFEPDGSVVLDVDGDVLDGTETFQFQYLVPGVAISNTVTITAADYVGEGVAPSMASTVAVSVAEGNTALPSFTAATGTAPITYSISGGDAARFTINESTGQPAFITAPNFEAPTDGGANNVYNFTRVATNTFGFATQAVAVTVTNVIEDTTPDAFSFTPVTGATPGATVTATAPITGVEVGATLTAVNFHVSNNNGSTWGSSTTYVAGQTLVRATVTANSTSEGTESQSGSVNGVSATFTVTTRAIDNTPDAIVFAPATAAEPGATITASDEITGVDAGVTLTAVTFELTNNNGGSWSSSVLHIPGQTFVRATVTANGTFGGTASQGGSVNGVSATFTATTRAANTYPNAFSLSPKFNVPVSSTQESNTITIAGIEAPAAISVTGGEYAVNTGSGFGAYTSASGTVSNGAQIKVRHTSADTEGASRSTVLTVGGRISSFVTVTEGGSTTDKPKVISAERVKAKPIVAKYMTVQGDTWDMISYKVFGSEMFTDQLLAINFAHRNTAVFSAGTELILPTVTVQQVQETNVPPWRRKRA